MTISVPKNEAKYLKKLYLLHGRNIPQVYFWALGKNPYRQYMFNNDIAHGSTSWGIKLYDFGFIENEYINRSDGTLKFTDKFINFIETVDIEV